MVIFSAELFYQSNGAPTGTENNELWLVLLGFLGSRVVIIDKVVDDGQVLWSSSSWPQRILGDGEITRMWILPVSCGVVGKEGYDNASRNNDEDAEPGEGFVDEAYDPWPLLWKGPSGSSSQLARRTWEV